MFNEFIKKTGKFFAVLLTAILVFTPLSYAEKTEGVIYANSELLPFTNAKIEHVYDKLKDRSNCQHTCIGDRVWAQYYYNTYQVNENESSPKFETNVNGFLMGFDIISTNRWEVGEDYSDKYRLKGKEKYEKGPCVNGKVTTSKWKMGIMAGYGTSDLKQYQDKTRMDDINLGLYGGYENENWLLKTMLLGGYEQYSTDRISGNTDYNGYSVALDFEAGYKLGLTNSQAKHKIYLKPFVGITGFYAINDDFQEAETGLNIKDNDYVNVQARGGIGINGTINRFGWYAKLGIRRLLRDDYVAIDGSLGEQEFRIRSAQLDKFSYGGGLGVDYQLSNVWTIFANGLANFAEKSANYYGNIGLMYKFGCSYKDKNSDEDKDKILEELNRKMAEEAALRRIIQEKEQALKEKERELQAIREKELRELKEMEAYKAKVISEQQAQKMKEKTIKNIRLAGKPTFKFGTSELNNNGKESLKQVAKDLENYPNAEILIEGHTDSIGSDEVNQRISEERAIAMAAALKKDYGVKNNIAVIGKGEREPIASNATEEGRAKNRRVEIILTTAE